MRRSKKRGDAIVEIVEVRGERLALMSWAATPAASLGAVDEEILRAIALGKTNAEIAAARGTSARTVANQVSALLKKFNVSSRYELVAVGEKRE